MYQSLIFVFIFLWPFSSDEDRCRYLFKEIEQGGVTAERMEEITRRPKIQGSNYEYFHDVTIWCKKKLY
jgi:hypothetical protein